MKKHRNGCAFKGRLAHLVSKKSYRDFVLRADPTYGTGAIVNFAAVGTSYPQAGGKWNSFEITARGNRITVLTNGVQSVDLLNSQLASGPITLQWGRGVIKFRKVQIREL